MGVPSTTVIPLQVAGGGGGQFRTKGGRWSTSGVNVEATNHH